MAKPIEIINVTRAGAEPSGPEVNFELGAKDGRIIPFTVTCENLNAILLSLYSLAELANTLNQKRPGYEPKTISARRGLAAHSVEVATAATNEGLVALTLQLQVPIWLTLMLTPQKARALAQDLLEGAKTAEQGARGRTT